MSKTGIIIELLAERFPPAFFPIGGAGRRVMAHARSSRARAEGASFNFLGATHRLKCEGG
jgi:hypothetical protein